MMDKALKPLARKGPSQAGVAPCDILTCLMSVDNRFLFCSGLAVPIGEAAKPRILECFKRGCYLVSCGRRGTL